MENIKKQVFLGCFFTGLVFAGFITPVSGDWNETIKEVDSFYTLVPDERLVHVFKEIHFTNYDSDTKYWQGYYNHLHHEIPENARNIDIWDCKNQKITIQKDPQDDYYVSELNQNLWYGDSYSIYMEYDLPVNENTAVFKLNENADFINATVIIPDGYEVSIDNPDYTTKHSSSTNMYKFNRIKDQLECSVDAVNPTEYNVLNKAVQLSDKKVDLKIEFWDGEKQWANTILNTTLKTLPVMEKLWGLTYPKDHNITITQSTKNGTSGYGGINNGKNGILMLHTSNKNILIHELAHYWTQNCNFKHIWMDEGYADLYTYIFLNRINPHDANERKEYFKKQYNSMKQSNNLVLSSWSVPDSIDSKNFDRVDYGYKKSFILVYNIYNKIGLESMKEANQEFLELDRTIGNDEYKHIIQTVSGKNLKNEWKLLHSDI